jgi:hypothetical protein
MFMSGNAAGKTGAVFPLPNSTAQAVAPRTILQDQAPNPTLLAPQVAQPQVPSPPPDFAVPPLVPLAPRSSLQQLLPLTGLLDRPDVPFAEDRLPWWGQIARGALAAFPASPFYPTAHAAGPPATGTGLAFTPQRPGASSLCVCPSCGTRVPNDGHLYCPAVPCPRCSRSMLPAVTVGTGPQAAPLATGASPSPTPPAAPAPAASWSPPPQASPGTLVAATAPPSYTTSVAPIVQRNCLRCHGGPMRNLGNYDNLKNYATGGLLMMMIQPGGPMSHFLTPSEAQTTIDWISAGEPR